MNIVLTGKPKQLATAMAMINEIINAPDERGDARREDRDNGRDSRSHRDNDNFSSRNNDRDQRGNRDRDDRGGNRDRDRDNRRMPDKDREPDFLCPQEKIGMVIGPKGANVNDIFARTGCKVQVEHDLPLVNGTDRIISFRGNSSQVALAKAMVRVVIATPDAPGYLASQGKPIPQQQYQQQQVPSMYQQTAQMAAMPAVSYGPFGATMAYNPYQQQQMAVPNGYPMQQQMQMPTSPGQQQQPQQFQMSNNTLPQQQQMYQMANGQMMYAAAAQPFVAAQPYVYGAPAAQIQYPQAVTRGNSPVYGLGSHSAQMAQYTQYAQQMQQQQGQGQQQSPDKR